MLCSFDEIRKIDARFEVLTEVPVKIIVFWNTKPLVHVDLSMKLISSFV
jgi:hypothetical protein